MTTFVQSHVHRSNSESAGNPGLVAIGRCAARVRSSKAWNYAEIATGHMVASNRPEELTRLLLERVAGS